MKLRLAISNAGLSFWQSENTETAFSSHRTSMRRNGCQNADVVSLWWPDASPQTITTPSADLFDGSVLMNLNPEFRSDNNNIRSSQLIPLPWTLFDFFS